MMKLSRSAGWKVLLAICLLSGLSLLFIYHHNPGLWMKAGKLYDTLRDPDQFKKVVSSFGRYSPLVFIFIQMTQVVIAPIPGGVTEFLGGYLFGVTRGLIYSMVGLILGSLFAFSVARVFEEWALEKVISPGHKKKFDYLIGHEGLILSFLLFLIPGFPKDALCYILGLTSMPFGIFLVISTLGRIPSTLIATLQGAKAFNHQYKSFLILSGISGLIILIFYIYHEEIHKLIKKVK
jgi:uncharacterized membrane protein YdjX (TVP38/TMEM64 family)